MENLWKNLIHLFVTFFLSNFVVPMVGPSIVDVTMEAVCPGKDECSLAIYLTGFQQAIAGLGAVVMMPLIGNLSDAYGRKNLLTVPMTISVFPLVLISLKRTGGFFYAFYALSTLTAMVCIGGVMCLSLSYVADSVPEGKRVSAIGLLCGVGSAATLCGTIAARLLPTAQIFQVAAVVSIFATVYMRIFLEETISHVNELEQQILETTTETNEVSEQLKKADNFNIIPLPKDIIRLLHSSSTVSLASFVAFFNSIGEAGVQALLMYYLKARFHFQKDQYADLNLITYIGATIANMVLMPILGPILGVETLLSIGLLAGFLHMLLDSIAWAAWVPYGAAFLGVLLSLASPSIRCIVSKQVGPNEQGIAQGCLMAISSLANVVSPLILSPLSAMFLSGNAPFNFPGFSILCIGLAWLVGFLLTTTIKIRPQLSRDEVLDGPCLLA